MREHFSGHDYVFSGGICKTEKTPLRMLRSHHCLVQAALFAAESQTDKERDFRQSRKIQTPVTIQGEEAEMAQTYTFL